MTLPEIEDPAGIALERWLRNKVVPVYDAMQADPARGIPANEVKAALRAHHEHHLKKGHA